MTFLLNNIVILLGAFALAACSSAERLEKRSEVEVVYASKPSDPGKADGDLAAGDKVVESPAPLDETPLEKVKPLSDEEALSYLKGACVSCHHYQSGAVRSFWSLNPETLSKAYLATDNAAPAVFFSVLVKSRRLTGTTPPQMPPTNVDAKTEMTLKRLVRWFQLELPTVVATGMGKYGNGTIKLDDAVGVNLNFVCEEPVSFRNYLGRLANDAFDREPTRAELALAGDALDKPVTEEFRKKMAERVFSDAAWHQDFIDNGLKKFANKLAGVSEINAIPGMLTEEQAIDLRDEFYQLLRHDSETRSFKDLLLGDRVYVTEHTAPLYEGCEAPTEAGSWRACQMQAPRGSFFTSVGFLRSKPTSFLEENNNYGRVSLMHFVVRGDVFKAGLTTVGDDSAVPPLPSCLKTKDWRAKRTTTDFAMQGTAAVPARGNLCQSCHIARQLAAGSILFRPFNAGGLIYGTANPIDEDPSFATATAEDRVNVPPAQDGETLEGERVSLEFLDGLLSGTDEQACSPPEAGDKDSKEVIFRNVKDLASYLIGDGGALSSGLARHIPRALSNFPNTSEELIVSINDAYNRGGGKLNPAFKAYFASETYACKRQP